MKLHRASQPSKDGESVPDLFVFSHLRWHFVTQRPQHLLTRAAKDRRVYFWEEPTYDAHSTSADLLAEGRLEFLFAEGSPNITVIRPHLRAGEGAEEAQRRLLDRFLGERNITRFDAWFYTPMALAFAAHLRPEVTIYDAMDELSAFAGAPPKLIERERELFRRANVVFTGGRSLYEHKRAQHHNVHPFPSSIEAAHFARALEPQPDPADQAGVPRPRVGFFGVLDERFDCDLLAAIAHLRPDVHFVLLGPVVKIDAAVLPKAPNLHFFGSKSYAELPAYLSGWDAAILPFALNESTRFISPTKTPEYLAAGKRVISTPIRDVVHDYGDRGLVEIADTPQAFVEAIDRALHAADDPQWRAAVRKKLSSSSWDSTWAGMHQEIERARSAQDAVAAERRATSLEIVRHPKSSPGRETYDYLVVGAGFAGAVVAERLAAGMGKRVLVVDKRSHIAGNAYDYYNEHGVLVHLYGPHIFHTQSEKVFNYLSQFTDWRSYEHKVLASVDGQLVPIPINLDTINRLYGLNLDAEGMQAFLAERVEAKADIRTSEDIVVSRVGRELYEKFFKHYTRKQWGVDPSDLDASVAGRIPVRFDHDDRYFSDTFQAMPLEGYTRMFERMLSHPNITVMLSTDYREIMDEYPEVKTVYTGPIDEFFDYRFGKLPYRSLRFEHETHDQEQFQAVGVVNYPNEHRYTRVTEFKHLTGQVHPKTSIVYEYPQAEGDPYYPIPRPENARLYEMYRELADGTPGVYFCGRLANYKYFNMDQVVAQALHLYRNIAEEEVAALVLRPRRSGVSVPSPVRQHAAVEVAAPKSDSVAGAS